MARPPVQTLCVARIEIEEKTTDLKLPLKGKLAGDLADYLRAHNDINGQSVELDLAVPHMLATFMDADRGLQARSCREREHRSLLRF